MPTSNKYPMYYLPTHPYAFRSGKAALITGTEIVYPDNHAPRMCYRLRWPDGVEDLAPVNDETNSRLLFSSEDELRAYLNRENKP